ncbi:MAG: prepilin-type N-terminal cleavage/methylation domain-containing protein [Brotaphodocola sp.]
MWKKLQHRLRERAVSWKNDCSGVTLVEVIVVLVIIGVLFSIIIPSMTGYIDKAKQQKYVMEAQGVRQSIEMYLLNQYAYDDIDMMELLEMLSTEDLNSSDCVISDFMKVTCTKGAHVQNLTMEDNGVHIRQMVYLVDGYEIEITDGDFSVTSIKK